MSINLGIDLQENIGQILVINPSRSNALSDYTKIMEIFLLPGTFKVDNNRVKYK